MTNEKNEIQMNSHAHPEGTGSSNENHDASHNPGGAAHAARSKIDRIYDTNPPHQTDAVEEATPTDAGHVQGVYAREHDNTAEYDWRAYHTAWQDYYQKYYHRQYLERLHVERQRQIGESRTTSSSPKRGHTDRELQNDLLQRVGERAKKAHRSPHFMPIASALIVGLLFLFLNYNKLLFADVYAYISPSTQVSDNVIIDPNASVPVSAEPRLIVPKINVDVPLFFGLKSLDNESTQAALEDGVVHYPIPGANSLPGETGNSVFLGHSSHTVWNSGHYKFVFVLLPRMEIGDLFYINYKGERYVYKVSRKEVITPDQVDRLITPTNKPMATLVTCVPIGTNAKRLLLFADQISPDPSVAKHVQNEGNSEKNISIPGNTPTILEQLFGS